MNRKIFSHNVQEAVEYLFSKETDDDIVASPPTVYEQADEEEIDDDKLHVSIIKDIAGEVEVTSRDDEYQKIDMPSNSDKKTKKLKTGKPEVVQKTKTSKYAI